jgi:hypothetical protein
MSFQDKSIQCSDCGTTFSFSAGEQEFFASKGFTNEPKRCPHAAEQGRWGVTEMATTATGPDPGIKRLRLFDTTVHGMHKEM